jgi:hypothetical protein
MLGFGRDKNENKSEMILRRRQNDVLDSLNEDTERLWKLCHEQVLWLEGDPKEVEGREVDYSMFDFVIATTNFRAMDKVSYLGMMQRFWWTLYPHIKKLNEGLKNYETQFKTVMGIEDRALKGYADQHLELACYRLFLEEELGKHMSNSQAKKLRAAFHNFHQKYDEESKAKIAKIKAEEEEKNKIREEKLRKRKEEEDKRAFERSLRY